MRLTEATSSNVTAFSPPDGASQAQIARTRAAMLAQASAQRNKLASLDQQIAQKIAEADVLVASINKLEVSFPFVAEEADIRKKAAAIEYGNRIAHLDAQIRLADQTNELTVQKRHAAEVLAARLALESQREQAVSEYMQKVLSDLAEAEQKVADLGDDLAKANQKIDQTLLRAPVDGTVQQLAVHSIGGVVTPAQQLMMIVPAESRIEVEAMISNRDIGFVRPGQEAEVKIDTFNFTRYGLIGGNVVSVSQDSIAREKPADKLASNEQRGALTDTSEPQGQELVYATRVSLERTNLDVDGRSVDLAPGMAVTVEIKTGSRRLIEFLLSPLLRYKQQSLRER